jgi:hypothetical protein
MLRRSAFTAGDGVIVLALAALLELFAFDDDTDELLQE